MHNSYRPADSINEIDWSGKARFAELFRFYKELIAVRKGHPAFRLPTTELIQAHVKFIDEMQDSVFVAYCISHVQEDR